ncbi:MAG: type II toxin-antitoxin system VapC family toxin [Chloroflexi bacterium]|nr:type II toxin-antitoxin system VapC family toxin [Chloroflexota bacterium]
MYLLDTNVCIAYLNGRSPAILRRFKQTPSSQVWLYSVVKAELLYGVHHRQRPAANLEQLQFFFAPFGSLPFDDAAAEEYGRIRDYLARQGQPIGPHDQMIASIARANKLVLVTNNKREFSRVPDLQLEDWL